MKHLIVFLLSLCLTPLFAGEVPANLKARVAKGILASSGVTSVICSDATLASEFQKAGMTVGDSKVAYGADTAEVKALAAKGKLVICGSVADLSAGGSLAIVEEGGKPKVYLHMGNVAKSGVVLGDLVLKIATKL